MSLCADCIKGVTHEGEPQGKWEKIGGVDTYVSTPTRNYPKEKAIIFLADVLGPQYINAQLLADDFAANGFKCYAPDYLNGDAVPAYVLDNRETFDAMSWLGKHTQAITRPTLDKFLEGLRQHGVTKFGATGYCFGGRYVFDLAFDNIIQVAVVSHPSLLHIPADLEKYQALSKAPLLINSCPVDAQFPLESSEKADEILGNGRFAPGYKREYFEGCTHGFAVRGDMTNENIKAGKEGAFKAAAEWFIQRL